MNMRWATHSSKSAISLVIHCYDVILQYRDDHHLWFNALYGMFDALNGHFGDDVEGGMVAYPLFIIRFHHRRSPSNLKNFRNTHRSFFQCSQFSI